jgi:peptidoglycan/xylan/chitin deacetylase (PgdA/CDA1 family)
MPGHLVVSLDLELHWGIRDHTPLHAPGVRDRLLGVRQAVPAVLRLFRERGIRATWAAVGALFARDRDELEAHLPRVRPRYRDASLDPYTELPRLGRSEEDDPFHYAPSLIDQIAATPGQELGTHTFAHTYGLEPGASLDAFVSDLQAARAIMGRRGLVPRSIVFPRNQYGPDHVRVLPGLGIVAFRGGGRGSMYQPRPGSAETRLRRGARLLDSYLPLVRDTVRPRRWPDAPVVDVPASRFLRPHDRGALDALRLARIERSMTAAARTGADFHLWWHPHNMGVDREANLSLLARVLDRFAALSDAYGLTSATMADRADAVLAGLTAPVAAEARAR